MKSVRRQKAVPLRGAVCFLLGAGASMPAGIPNVNEFVTEFKNDILLRRGDGDPLVRELDVLERAWTAAAKEDSTLPARLGLERLYELLSHLTGQQEAIQTIPLQLSRHFPPPSRKCELLAWELKKYVQKRCLGFRRSRLRYLQPLVDFIDPGAGLDILTLNYDTCIETLLQREKKPWVDGFPEDGSPLSRFLPETFLRKPNGSAVRILKLHGSASWYRASGNAVARVLGSSQSSVGLRFGTARSMTHEAMMIYPTLQKSLASGPFPALILAAQEILNRCKLILAVGYGFADRHIREMVLRALEGNPELRLVLVDPWPEGAVGRIFGDVSRTRNLRGRIGVCGTEEAATGGLRYGFVDQALKKGWLLQEAIRWIEGSPLVDPLPALQARQQGQTWRWDLRYPLEAGASHIARGAREPRQILWVLGQEPRTLCRLDLASGTTTFVPLDLVAPRGFTWDPGSELLYVVENLYRTRRGLPEWPKLSSKTGMGRLWAIDTEGRRVRALTRMRLAIGLPRLVKAGTTDKAISETLGRGTGLLSWPVSVLLEREGRSVLVTEARALTRVDLKTRKLSHPLEIPLCFNLCSLSEGPGETVLMVDGGVAPRGRGRLLLADLAAGRVNVLNESATSYSQVGYHKGRGVALVSTGMGWPRGQVLAFRLVGGHAELLGAWEGLEQPGSIVVMEETDSALVATAQGIAELSLASMAP